MAAVRNGMAPELVWLLEHPPLYTAGTSADPRELIDPDRFPVYAAGRGGRYTYHGPGQRIAYVMLDLKRRGADVRRHVERLEGWVIDALAAFGVHGERRAGRIGIWVATGSRDGSQDRRHRGARAALGQLSWRRDQRGARSRTLPGHRALWN